MTIDLNSVTDCRADLFAARPSPGRKVNTPEMTIFIQVKRLQNTARGDTVSDAGLDNLFRLRCEVRHHMARTNPASPSFHH